MKEYTIKFTLMTAKPGRGKSTISGGSCNGEIDITVDGPFDKENKTDPELVNGCKQMMQQNPGIKKMGAIVSLEILEINEK